MTISAGKLVVGITNGALGATNSGTTIASGATLDVNDSGIQGELIHVQGDGYDGLGAIINSDTLNTSGRAQRVAQRRARRPDHLRRLRSLGHPRLGSDRVGQPGGHESHPDQGRHQRRLPDRRHGRQIGNVLVNEGNFVIESASIINPDASINLSNGTSLAFYRLYNPMGRNVTVGDLATIRATSNTTNTQNEVAGTVTLNGQGILSASGGAQLNMSGPVVGSGGLVKADSGTAVLLNGANNWLGGTTISNGTLSVGNGIVNGSLPATPALHQQLRHLDVSTWPRTPPSLRCRKSPARRLTKRGDGMLALTVSNSFTGPVNTGTGAPLAGGIIQLPQPRRHSAIRA